MSELEEGARLALDFGKLAAVAATGARVVPVVLQDADSGEVLFIGYANEEALEASLRERIAVLWSTSRNELWRKGATSGDVLELAEIRVNCEQNSLLYLVRRTTGGACHTLLPAGSARPGCFYRTIAEGTLQHLTPLPGRREYVAGHAAAGLRAKNVCPAQHDVLMTDPGPETDDRHPADVVTGMVDHVLHLAATWPWWDGHPIEIPVDGEPPRIYTPHKAIRRVADHLIDHLAELEARLAGRPTEPDRWHASAITT